MQPDVVNLHFETVSSKSALNEVFPQTCQVTGLSGIGPDELLNKFAAVDEEQIILNAQNDPDLSYKVGAFLGIGVMELLNRHGVDPIDMDRIIEAALLGAVLGFNKRDLWATRNNLAPAGLASLVELGLVRAGGINAFVVNPSLARAILASKYFTDPTEIEDYANSLLSRNAEFFEQSRGAFSGMLGFDALWGGALKEYSELMKTGDYGHFICAIVQLSYDSYTKVLYHGEAGDVASRRQANFQYRLLSDILFNKFLVKYLVKKPYDRLIVDAIHSIEQNRTFVDDMKE